MNCPRCQSKTMVIRTIQLPAKTIRTRLCPRCSCEFSTIETPAPNQPFSDKLPGQTS
ncbi:hypothetical protein MASR1M36_08690 [Candidatus Cloacimonadaceae bacterium]